MQHALPPPATQAFNTASAAAPSTNQQVYRINKGNLIFLQQLWLGPSSPRLGMGDCHTCAGHIQLVVGTTKQQQS